MRRTEEIREQARSWRALQHEGQQGCLEAASHDLLMALADICERLDAIVGAPASYLVRGTLDLPDSVVESFRGEIVELETARDGSGRPVCGRKIGVEDREIVYCGLPPTHEGDCLRSAP